MYQESLAWSGIDHSWGFEPLWSCRRRLPRRLHWGLHWWYRDQSPSNHTCPPNDFRVTLAIICCGRQVLTDVGFVYRMCSRGGIMDLGVVKGKNCTPNERTSMIQGQFSCIKNSFKNIKKEGNKPKRAFIRPFPIRVECVLSPLCTRSLSFSLSQPLPPSLFFLSTSLCTTTCIPLFLLLALCACSVATHSFVVSLFDLVR